MSQKKIGRNEPCWCGSGKKYKRCHLNRESDEPIESWDVAKAMKERFTQRVCSAPESMHSECGKKIVKAHTVPKSSSLKAIAKDGHVLGLKMELENIVKHEGKLKLEPIGINNASTFTGFCQKHDNELFSCLEKERFSYTNEQCFQLAFRSFSRESYTKSAMVDMHDIHSELDKGKPLHRQMEIQEQSFSNNLGASKGAEDNASHKIRFDKCIENEDFSDIRACVFEYSDPFPVQASSSLNPDFDFENNKLQDLADFEIVPDMCSFTSFYDGEKSLIVFSWLNHCHNACKALIESLLKKPTEEISTYLLQYIFSNFENFFVSPTWWDSISAGDREAIVEISKDNVSIFQEPHGKSIAKKILQAQLPKPEVVKCINWQKV